MFVIFDDRTNSILILKRLITLKFRRIINGGVRKNFLRLPLQLCACRYNCAAAVKIVRFAVEVARLLSRLRDCRKGRADVQKACAIGKKIVASRFRDGGLITFCVS